MISRISTRKSGELRNEGISMYEMDEPLNQKLQAKINLENPAPRRPLEAAHRDDSKAREGEVRHGSEAAEGRGSP